MLPFLSLKNEVARPGENSSSAHQQALLRKEIHRLPICLRLTQVD